MAWGAVVVFVTVLSVGVQCWPMQNLVPQVLSKFDIKSLLGNATTLENTECGADLEIYFNGTLELREWALKMLDSTAKIPDGLLIANTYFMGQFDECVSVSDVEISFIGKYCLPTISGTIDLGPFQRSQMDVPEWAAVPSYHFGICIPSSCSALELETRLNDVLSMVGLKVELPEELCRTNEHQTLSTGDWVVIAFLALIVLTMIESTVYDVYQRVYLNRKPHPLMTAFSAYSNLQNLMTPTTSGQMSCIHGLRALSIAWVMLGHSYLLIFSSPNTNYLDVLTVMTQASKMPIINALFSVDSFFFLSGLLICFVFFRDMERNGSYDIPMGYIHRYLRLTPPYAVTILLQVTILRVIGDGPLWYSMTSPLADTCTKSWWSGLLYVQNFVDPKSSCLGQSWYLSADMQMYWVAPLLLYPMYLWPKFGTIWLGLVTAAALCLNFSIAYINDLGPSSAVTNNFDHDAIDYVQFYMRAVPWLIGMAVGYLICGLKARKIEVKLPKIVVLLGWLLSTGMALSSLYTLHVFIENEYNSLEAAFYISLTRLAWGLVLAWIVFACLYGYGGPVNVFLSWSLFQPLGKLSYCVFLIHMSIQYYRIGILRNNIYAMDVSIVYTFLADYMLANLISIPFTLAFEMPFANIEKCLFRNLKIIPLPRQRKNILETQRKTNMEEGRADENHNNAAFVREER